jgi:oxalate decarboxylase/phosphoglucose isomerase-like protein (cupin superfamily)
LNIIRKNSKGIHQTRDETVLKRKRFVKPKDVETYVFKWGYVKWLCEPRSTGAKKFSTGVVFLKPGKGHLRHNHPGVEEILYVISGEGEQMVGRERRHVTPGTLIYIPHDVFHETINTGWEPLKFIAVYSPPGPESDQKNNPDVEVLPPGKLPNY